MFFSHAELLLSTAPLKTYMASAEVRKIMEKVPCSQMSSPYLYPYAQTGTSPVLFATLLLPSYLFSLFRHTLTILSQNQCDAVCDVT